MKRRLQAKLVAFDALSLRERVLVAVCVLAALGFLFQFLFLGPMEQRAKALNQRIEVSRASMAREAGQIAALDKELRDRDGALKGRVEALKVDLARQNEQFKAVESRLVPPRDMPRLLQGLLAKRAGLQLVSLRSLAPQPVVSAAKAAETAQKPVGAGQTPEASRVEGGGGVYRHGVEVSVQGRYGDLLAYVEELEKLPQKMLWQELHFKVEEYPRTTLSFTVYTLSLETTWLQM